MKGERENMGSLRCIVVGAGPTGSMVACFLKRMYKERINLEVWDKSRGIGGRMSTHRYGDNSLLSVDLGAQYITAFPEYKVKHLSLYEELTRNNVLTPLDAHVSGMQSTYADADHFVARNGIAELPKYFLKESGCVHKTQTRLDQVNFQDKTAMLEATIMDGRTPTNEKLNEHADIVVITMPSPQLLQLKGDIKNSLDPFEHKLRDIQYSKRFALGLFYPGVTKVDSVDWDCKYTKDNPCLCFISMDTRKRKRDSVEGLSILAHASVPYSLKHLEDNPKDVEETMLTYVRNEIPGLPDKPDKSRLLRWLYSQVRNGYEGKPGHLVLSKTPLVICAGDAFIHSNFDACAESALSVVECLKSHFPVE